MISDDYIFSGQQRLDQQHGTFIMTCKRAIKPLDTPALEEELTP
jgi:hypothetical protein